MPRSRTGEAIARTAGDPGCAVEPPAALVSRAPPKGASAPFQGRGQEKRDTSGQESARRFDRCRCDLMVRPECAGLCVVGPPTLADDERKVHADLKAAPIRPDIVPTDRLDFPFAPAIVPEKAQRANRPEPLVLPGATIEDVVYRQGGGGISRHGVRSGASTRPTQGKRGHPGQSPRARRTGAPSPAGSVGRSFAPARHDTRTQCRGTLSPARRARNRRRAEAEVRGRAVWGGRRSCASNGRAS